MAAEFTRHPREDPFLPGDGNKAAEGQGASGGETLAEKIRRYRQPGARLSGGATSLGSRVVRHPREE